ncbi:hypothetical protein [Arthrobacter sp. GMC3]|uniref:hypothetical protein n=1 Tax=Arthrobacter sp. GMC3 TaxID=2058894 RepID=UPI0011B0610F|nr:hypothetical protein [Arthrobacter sp. GMC3]
MKRYGIVWGLLFAVSLSACSGPVSVEISGGEKSTSTSGAGAGYLSQVDANGLIAGKSYSTVVGEATMKCLEDLGWADVDVSDTGAITLRDMNKAAKFDVDMRQCSATVNAQYPLPPITDNALEQRYGYEVKTRECLIGMGYSISEAPSKKTWIEQMRLGDAGMWLPYAELYSENTISPAKEKTIKQTCPDPAERIYVG